MCLEPYDPIPLGGEVDIACRTPHSRNQFLLLAEVGFGQIDAFVRGGQDDLCPGAPDRVDQRILVVGGRRPGKENVDADDLGASGVESVHQPRQQRTIDGLADLVVLQGFVGDADEGHMRMLARQLVGQIRGANVTQHVLEPQQARRVAGHDLGEQQCGEDRKDRAQKKWAWKQRAGPYTPGIIDHRKRPIVPAARPYWTQRSETSASIHALPGRAAGI